jgi:hypothetical protein
LLAAPGDSAGITGQGRGPASGRAVWWSARSALLELATPTSTSALLVVSLRFPLRFPLGAPSPDSHPVIRVRYLGDRGLEEVA